MQLQLKRCNVHLARGPLDQEGREETKIEQLTSDGVVDPGLKPERKSHKQKRCDSIVLAPAVVFDLRKKKDQSK